MNFETIIINCEFFGPCFLIVLLVNKSYHVFYTMMKGEDWRIQNSLLLFLTLSSNNAAHFTDSLLPLCMPVVKSKLLAVLSIN